MNTPIFHAALELAGAIFIAIVAGALAYTIIYFILVLISGLCELIKKLFNK